MPIITLAADPRHTGRWFALWRRFRVAAPTHPGSIVCCRLAVSPGRLWWLSTPSFFDVTPVAIYSRRLGD